MPNLPRTRTAKRETFLPVHSRCRASVAVPAQTWKVLMDPITRPTRLFRPKEAARFLQVAESTLAKRRMRGEAPPFVKLGHSVRYRFEDLQRCVEAATLRSTSEMEAR